LHRFAAAARVAAMQAIYEAAREHKSASIPQVLFFRIIHPSAFNQARSLAASSPVCKNP
jgi:hypothetical protein